jgi:hypothetical protein
LTSKPNIYLFMQHYSKIQMHSYPSIQNNISCKILTSMQRFSSLYFSNSRTAISFLFSWKSGCCKLRNMRLQFEGILRGRGIGRGWLEFERGDLRYTTFYNEIHLTPVIFFFIFNVENWYNFFSTKISTLITSTTF